MIPSNLQTCCSDLQPSPSQKLKLISKVRVLTDFCDLGFSQEGFHVLMGRVLVWLVDYILVYFGSVLHHRSEPIVYRLIR